MNFCISQSKKCIPQELFRILQWIFRYFIRYSWSRNTSYISYRTRTSIKIDTKPSKSLYERLGEDITKLKDKVRVTVSRGIATNMSFEEIAMNINLQSRIGINNVFRIAKTEGHRIQCEATYNVQNKAKEKGVDILKNEMLL